MYSYIDIDAEGYTEAEICDIVTCLRTLLSVRAGSVPLDRDFGIDYDGCMGYPLNVAENYLSVEIVDKVARYEPRVEVDSVTFEYSTEGQLIPTVKVIAAEADDDDDDEDDE